jgi:hypothetical protein
MMKYKIIPDDIVKNLIEFIDEIQFEAAKTNTADDLHRINFCNYLISELMNGLDGFDLEDPDEKDRLSTDDLKDRWDDIESFRKDIRMDFPEDMSEAEWKKLIKQFDSFIDGWDKEYKKSNYRDKSKQYELKKFLQELRIDHELTPKEKFELYYDEYRSRKKGDEVKSLAESLKKAGLKKPPGNSQTPKK